MALIYRCFKFKILISNFPIKTNNLTTKILVNIYIMTIYFWSFPLELFTGRKSFVNHNKRKSSS